MNAKRLESSNLRTALVAIALEWQRRYGVAPAITSAVSEYDARGLSATPLNPSVLIASVELRLLAEWISVTADCVIR